LNISGWKDAVVLSAFREGKEVEISLVLSRWESPTQRILKDWVMPLIAAHLRPTVQVDLSLIDCSGLSPTDVLDIIRPLSPGIISLEIHYPENQMTDIVNWLCTPDPQSRSWPCPNLTSLGLADARGISIQVAPPQLSTRQAAARSSQGDGEPRMPAVLEMFNNDKYRGMADDID